MIGITDKIQQDFDYCEDIIKKNSLNFYAAFSTLPKEKAQSIYAIYAFCRESDDSIDERRDIEALCKIEDELERFLSGGNIDTPIWRALRVVFDNYQMDSWAFRAMIDGQKKDYTFHQPQTQNDLEAYCYLVAGSVGLMLMPVLSSKHRDWRREAIHLGVAMQLTNILRDVGEDFRKGRVYFPSDCMAEHGYTMGDFEKGVIDGRFTAMWESQAQKAEALYDSFERAVPMLDSDSKFPVICSSRLYGSILDEVRANDYDCFTQRAYVDEAKRFEILDSVLKYVEAV